MQPKSTIASSRWRHWTEPASSPPRSAFMIALEPRLMPIFGPRSFTPQTTCDDIHPSGPVPTGSANVCMSCHKSGIDSHPRLRTTGLDRNGERIWPKFGELSRYNPDGTLCGGTGEASGSKADKQTRKERRRLKRDARALLEEMT